MFIISAAFEIHAKPFSIDRRRIQSTRLKLVQFVATRPTLLPVVKEWSESRHDAQAAFATSHSLRRGFLSDKTHDDVVGFLVARGIFLYDGIHLSDGGNSSFLASMYKSSCEMGLFGVERRVLSDLLTITITNSMLEGW
jgi:MFS-type transporter involved in bile tolerance (Atg22 family)